MRDELPGATGAELPWATSAGRPAVTVPARAVKTTRYDVAPPDVGTEAGARAALLLNQYARGGADGWRDGGVEA